MAKFDIVSADSIRPGGREEANYEPSHPPDGLRTDSIRIHSCNGALSPHVGTVVISAVFLVSSWASADPVAITPDPPPRSATNAFQKPLPPTWDLDGMYLWLGPTGSAGWIGSGWDSIFGGDATVVRVRERETLGAIGGTFGAARWTERGGGRAWLDLLAGTPAFGHMFGVSAGPLLEMNDIRHSAIGGSIGLWAFVGITPYVRVGAVDGLGEFAEVGVHIALPVLRRRVH